MDAAVQLAFLDKIPGELLRACALPGHDHRGGRLRRPGPAAGGRRRAVREELSLTLTAGFDWELRAAAVEVSARAYAPYSHSPWARPRWSTTAGSLVGCNVENAAYGVTLCAECGVVSPLHATGGGRLTHFVCVNGSGDVIMPCGRCRQLLFEHGGPRCC